MESNAHRRSIGIVIQDALPPSSDAPVLLASLTVSKIRKRLRPAVESKKKTPRTKNTPLK